MIHLLQFDFKVLAINVVYQYLCVSFHLKNPNHLQLKKFKNLIYQFIDIFKAF